MILCRKITFILLIVHGAISCLYGQDLLNYSNSLKYANYLYDTKQYNLSAIEYERVSYLEPKDTLAKLRMVKSYSLMHDYKNAQGRLEKLFPFSISNYPEEFAVEYYSVLFRQNKFKEATNFINDYKAINQAKRAEYELGALLMEYKWDEAKTKGNDFMRSKQADIKICSLIDIAEQGLKIKYKKPGCAALLSALIPGSGKVYTKNWKDGVYAFIFISAFSWLTYKSISNDDLVFNSVLYGTITLSFYSANIYGSYKSAEKYNQKANLHATREVQRILFND